MINNCSITTGRFDRRQLLRVAACGFGSVALQGMMSGLARAAGSPLAARAPHFAPRARRVIFLFIQGGPSQLDLFAPKALITRKHGEKIRPPIDGHKVTIGVDKYLALAPVAPVRPRGASGMMISDLMPHLASVADEICLLRAVHTDNEAHAPATLQMHTGVSIDVRPSMGSWFSYGLGTENENLPSFITIHPDSDVRTYGAGFLPAAHQGTPVNVTAGKEAAIRYLVDHESSAAVQRKRLDLIQAMNRGLLRRVDTDRQMEGMIESYELAFRMQTETPRLVDLSGETQGDSRSVRHRPARDRSARPGLPARPPAQRGGRPLRPGHDQRLGPPRQHPGSTAQELRRIRPARRRPDQGPQVARLAR